jgi:hypothetical protein
MFQMSDEMLWSYDLFITVMLTSELFVFQMSGEMLWSCDLCKPVFSSPALTQHGVCLGCTDMCLYHFSAAGNLVTL